MFCRNCGNEIKATAKFCTVCGKPVETEQEARQPTPEETAGENVEKAAEKVSKATGSIAEKMSGAAKFIAEKVREICRKGSNIQRKGGEGGFLHHLLQGKNKVRLIVCAVVLVAAIPCIANAARLNNFFHKTFSSPDQYFQYVAKKEMRELSDLIAGYYGDTLFRLEFYDVERSAEITLKPGEEMRKLTGLTEDYLEKIGVELSDLESLEIGMEMSAKDDVFGYGLTAEMNKINLFSVNTVMDMEQGGIYLQVPELTKIWLGADVNEFDDKYENDMKEILENQEMYRQLVKSLPKKSEVEKLVRRYLEIIVENMDNVSIGRKEQLRVEKIYQKCTELKITVDGETLQNVTEAVLEEALVDRKLQEIIVKAADAAGKDGDEVYDKWIENLEDMLDKVEALSDTGKEAEILVYVDSKGGIIGFSIEQKTYQGDEVFSVLTAREGSNVAYEFSEKRGGSKVMEFSGQGRRSGDRLTGDFRLDVSGQDMLDVKVTKLDVEKLKQGHLNGKVEIYPSSELSAELSTGIGIPALSSIIKRVSLAFDCKSSEKSTDCTATVNYNGEEMFSLEVAARSGRGSKVSIPGGKSVIMTEDTDDVQDYFEEMNWDKFLTALEKTNVLSETAELLEDRIDDLMKNTNAFRHLKLGSLGNIMKEAYILSAVPSVTGPLGLISLYIMINVNMDAGTGLKVMTPLDLEPIEISIPAQEVPVTPKSSPY